MTSDPDQLRRQIEGTQQNLSTDVDALAEKVTPSRIMKRRVHGARGRIAGWRDRIMGSAPGTAVRHRMQDATSSTAETTRSAASSVTDTAQSAVGSVQQAPQAIRRGTEGNPLAAGLIAFGAGWLAGSVLPSSKPEQRLAGQVTETARSAAQPMAEQASSAARQAKENLREPAQQAVESVKETATDAASTVKDEAQSAAEGTKQSAQQ